MKVTKMLTMHGAYKEGVEVKGLEGRSAGDSKVDEKVRENYK